MKKFKSEKLNQIFAQRQAKIEAVQESKKQAKKKPGKKQAK